LNGAVPEFVGLLPRLRPARLPSGLTALRDADLQVQRPTLRGNETVLSARLNGWGL